jgi:hypothetical protein
MKRSRKTRRDDRKRFDSSVKARDARRRKEAERLRDFARSE